MWLVLWAGKKGGALGGGEGGLVALVQSSSRSRGKQFGGGDSQTEKKGKMDYPDAL